MSKKLRVEAKPGANPANVAVEATTGFRHDGIYRQPGDVVEMSAQDAADLIALGFARPTSNVEYKRRDMRTKG